LGYLQYPPGSLVNDAIWNKQANYNGACPAFSAGNAGPWQLTLQYSATRSVTFNVFVNASAPKAVNDSYSMTPNTTLNVNAADGVLKTRERTRIKLSSKGPAPPRRAAR
jgi:hypothetical protein